MSNYPRQLIETSTYVTSLTEAQGLWKPWEQLQNRYNHIWPNGVIPAMEYLVVAGGGGSAGVPVAATGGGAGGMVVGATTSTLLTFPLTVTVGTGGATQSSGRNQTLNGTNSLIGPIIAFGGGGGGGGGASSWDSGRAGGSGGGASNPGTGGLATQISYPTYGGIGYGNNGGSDGLHSGGGGAGGVATSGGFGGPGRASSITGVSVTYARGGNDNNGPTVANSGNGGWGSSVGSSGIVVIAYPIYYQKLNINSGLTYTYSDTARSGYHLFEFTAGSGTINLPTNIIY